MQFTDENLAETKISFADLRHIEGSTAGTLLIYLLKNSAAFQLTDENFKNICRLLCKLFVRRSFTGKPRSNALDDIFIKFIDAVEENSCRGSEIENNLRETLRKASADDETFARELHGDLYDGTSKDARTRFILAAIANVPKIDFWRDWSIEHILPQTLKRKNSAKLDNYWIEILDGESKALEVQANYVHKLGNWTLTLYNSELSNKPFPDKKPLLVNLSGNDGLNSYVVAQENWTPAQIDARTEILIKKILKIFAW